MGFYVSLAAVALAWLCACGNGGRERRGDAGPIPPRDGGAAMEDGWVPPADAGPACTDGVRNGDETGTDCGGATCSGCPMGSPCRGPRSSSATAIDVRAVLHEGSNDVDVCYVDTTVGSASYDAGRSATSGIQGSGVSLQYSCNTGTLAEGLWLMYVAP